VILRNEQIDGKYEILAKIREGGMGAIYKVRHRLLDEVRVVKVVRSQADSVGEAADRFLREAKSAIKLRHPNVAILHDFAVGPDGRAFIVMEYIEGWNLLEVLNGYGPPPLGLTLEIARQSLKALGYLHRHKIVHRDVSPDNLMLTRDVDGNPLVKLIDLGIAKALEAGASGLTATGVFLGKPRYGSPERFNGAAWDERSDLYSFGVVLYELLTGCCPITGTDPAALMAGHLFRPPREFAETDPRGRVPQELREIVLAALAKKPEERVASAEDFVWELTLLQDRLPLGREEADAVWRVLEPLSPAEVAAPEPPGSTQTDLDFQFGMLNIAASLLGADSPLASVLPFSPETRAVTPPARPSEPTRRVAAEEDLNAWASRPMRTSPVADSEEPPLVPARVRTPRRPLAWMAAAGVALSLFLLGVWLARPPRPIESIGSDVPVEPRPPRPQVLPASTTGGAAPAASIAPVAITPAPAPPPVEASPNPAPATTARVRRTPAPVPLHAMRPGDMILRGHPGVQAPEVKLLPTYSYPAAARGSGRRAAILVAVLVDEAGRVLEAHIREGDRSSLGFEGAALDAARRARFFPATRDGIAGKMWTELLLEFAE
jgi:TonB family protein